MALTKVTGDFIKDGSITQGHLHASHGITTSDIGEGSNLYFTTARVDSRIGDLSTSNLSEGTNLYYTDARARGAISVSGNALSYNSSTGVITSNFEESPTFTGAVVGASFSAAGGFLNGSNGGIRIHSSGTKFFNITAANAARDGVMDIGASDARFKDLYLSGNITAGGNITGSGYGLFQGSTGNAPTGSGTFIGLTNNYGNIQFNGSGGGHIDFSSSGVDYAGRIIYFNSSDSFIIYTNAAQAITIDSSQNTTISGDLTVNGGDITLGGTGRIQGIDTVSANTDAANKLYVDNQVAGIVDSAPSTLDTLNELAAALGDDANFSVTVTNSIATKLPLAGGNMTGAINFDQTNSSGGGDFDFIIMGYNGSWSNNQNGLASIAVNDGTGIVGRYGITYGSGGGRFVVTDLYDGGYGASGDILTIAGNGATNLNGSFAATGNVTGANLNISNWNTAYGWGNHASAGYLTSFTETNGFLGDGGNASTHPGSSRLIYSGQVSAGTDVLGMPTSNNANAFINLNKHPGEYNSQLGFSSDGNIYYRNFNNTAINNSTAFRKIWDSGNDGSGSGLDADLLDGSHASSFWTKSGTWLGDLGSHSYTREIGLSMTGGSEFVVLSKSGQGSVLVDGHYMSYEAANGFFGSYNSAYGNLTGIRASAANTLKVMQLDGGNAILEVTQDVRAPLYYDLNNTTYYVNPATSSLLKAVQIDTTSNTVGSSFKIYTTTNQQYPQIHSNANLEAMWNYKNTSSEWYVGLRTSSQLVGTTGFHFYNTTSSQTVGGWDVNGHSYSIGSSRAPIFYDSSDTSTYFDSGEIVLRHSYPQIALRDTDHRSVVLHTNSNRFYVLGAPVDSTSYAQINGVWPWYVQLDTNNVYTGNIGYAGNSYRAPIFYDSNDTSYYTNPASTSNLSALNVGGSPVLREDNANVVRYRGSITSQDWNTYIDATEAGYNSVLNMSGSNRPSAYTYGIALNMAISGQGKAQLYFPETGSSSNGIYVRTGWNTAYRDWRSIALHNVNPQTGGSLYANSFYDSDNTGYYANPASTSKFSILEINNSGTGNQKIEFKDSSTSGYGALRFYYNNSEQNTIHVFGSTWSSSVWPTNSAGAINLSGYNGVTFGVWNNPGAWVYNSGQAQFNNSVRTPIFYDSNDTSYYINPNGATRLSGLKLEPASGTNQASGDDNVLWIHRTNNNDWGIQINADQSGATDYGYEFLGGSSHTYAFSGVAAGTRYFNVGSSYAQHDGSFRAPIFYDSNNTAYYTDPHTLSVMHSLKLIKHQNHTPRWDFSAYVVETPHHYSTSSTGGMYVGETNTIYLRTTAITTGDHRAPIYYDYTDTSYYLNPNSTSNLNAATFAGNVIGQNAYFGQDVGIGFTSGNIGGNLNIKNSAAGQIAAKIELGSSSNGNTIGAFIHTGASYASSGMFLNFQSNHISGDDNVLICYLDGDLVNKNNSYTQYSDERLKENIVDATPKLNEIKQIKVRNFNFKGEDLKQIGVVAQELEPIFPALVKEREVPGHDDPVKTVKYSVMVPILIKAMQEQQTIIDDLKSRLETLENQ